MGKGDKKSKRGKITIGSYGVKRKRKNENSTKPATPKKAKKAATIATALRPKTASEKVSKPKASETEVVSPQAPVASQKDTTKIAEKESNPKATSKVSKEASQEKSVKKTAEKKTASKKE